MKLHEIKEFLKDKVFEDVITLSVSEKIVDVNKFISSHVSILENNPGNKTYLCYYKRLLSLVNILKSIDLLSEESVNKK